MIMEGEHISHITFVILKEKEKLYVELKQILARQPGPEAAEQLQQYKWTLRDKASKLKVLLYNIPSGFLMHSSC